MTPKLVVATENAHKISEMKAILASEFTEAQLEAIVDLNSFPHGVVVEDGVTFEENALLKARAAARTTGLPALADDSGLSVEVLGGSPGIFSARWSGHHGDDYANLRLLLDQLKDVPDKHRGASFVCAMAIVFPDGREVTVQGIAKGHLAHAPHGSSGFGYDPIFVPLGLERTTAELTGEEKNALSHRGRALRALTGELAAILDEEPNQT